MDVDVDRGDKFHFRQQMFTSTYHVISTEDANMNQMEMFLSWWKLHHRCREMDET